MAHAEEMPPGINNVVEFRKMGKDMNDKRSSPDRLGYFY